MAVMIHAADVWAQISEPLSRPTKDSFDSAVIDVHVHLGGKASVYFEQAATAAMVQMNRLGIRCLIIMPPPFCPGHPALYSYRDLMSVAQKQPSCFSFLGGGGTLNVIIQQAVQSGTISPELKRQFDAQAEAVLAKGALGFGELAIEHLCLGARHNYQTAPADHPLFLRLADIAARHHVPIDLHMEAVPETMPLPVHLRAYSPPNPAMLTPNIAAFERLLRHNRQASIIWSHAGWCNTGQRTVALQRELLGRHHNLFMSLKISFVDSCAECRPVNDQGRLKAEWLELFQAFPDRFMIGSDQFIQTGEMQRNHPFPRSLESTHALLRQLPAELAQRIGYENAARLFHLKFTSGRSIPADK